MRQLTVAAIAALAAALALSACAPEDGTVFEPAEPAGVLAVGSRCAEDTECALGCCYATPDGMGRWCSEERQCAH